MPDDATAIRRARAAVEAFGRDPEFAVVFGRIRRTCVRYGYVGYRGGVLRREYTDKDEASEKRNKSNPTLLERRERVDNTGEAYDLSKCQN